MIILLLLLCGLLFSGCGGSSSAGGSSVFGTEFSSSSASAVISTFNVERVYTAENFKEGDAAVLMVSSDKNNLDSSFYFSANQLSARTGFNFKNLSLLENKAIQTSEKKDLDPTFREYGKYINELAPVKTKGAKSAKSYNEGDAETFNILQNGYTAAKCAAVCYKAGAHCYVFIDTESVNIPAAQRSDLADKIATAFDADNSPFTPGVGIYDKTRSFFGTEWTPGADGDTKIFILISPKLGNKLYGYFNSVDETESSNSNKKEIIYLNDDIFANNMYNGLATICHEFQHLINYNMKYKNGGAFEYDSIDEGQSMLCEYLNGFTFNKTSDYFGNGYAIRAAKSFLSQPSRFYFTYWGSEDYEYGGVFLFMLYVMERYGMDTVKNIAQSPVAGFANIEAFTKIPFALLYRDWTLVNYFSGLSGNPALPSGDTHNKYSLFNPKAVYAGYSARDNSAAEDYVLGGVAFSKHTSTYPESAQFNIGYYNCRYYLFTAGNGAAGNGAAGNGAAGTLSVIYRSKSDYSTYSNFVVEQPAGTFVKQQ